VEIERKFLVREPPADLDRHPQLHIEQGYLAVDGNGVELRVRHSKGRSTMTLKQGGGLVRVEEEFALGRERFMRLWPLTEGRRIVKTRHRVPHAGATIEVDVYAAALAGLVVAEVEFASVPASRGFEPPEWFAEELTGDERYANRSLACHGLPGDVRAFRLAAGERVGDGVRRIARGQIDAAIDDLTTADAGELGQAVHSARKHFKRLRSVVRLARDELGDDAYRRENEAFRDAGRRLSGARDSQVMVETLADLTKRYRDELAPESFAALRSVLVAEQLASQEALRTDTGAVADVVEELRAARARTSQWDVGGEEPDVLASGFERIYRRGRKASRAARSEPGDAALHDLRKRVKDLWYAGQLLRPAAPKRTTKLARRASDLSDVIGEDHDLAVLQQTAQRHAHSLTDDERRTLDELIQRRRAKLRRRVLKAARRLYARRPKAASRRIGLRG
jgi:CYTH domain-containing protein/CHAD domain-containing protein